MVGRAGGAGGAAECGSGCRRVPSLMRCRAPHPPRTHPPPRPLTPPRSLLANSPTSPHTLAGHQLTGLQRRLNKLRRDHTKSSGKLTKLEGEQSDLEVRGRLAGLGLARAGWAGGLGFKALVVVEC